LADRRDQLRVVGKLLYCGEPVGGSLQKSCGEQDMADTENPANGWTASGGDIYHFEQVDPAWAEEQLGDQQHSIYAVEVIRCASADSAPVKTHFITFYTFGFQAALARAAKTQIEPGCDKVLNIRRATAEEYLLWRAIYEHQKEALVPLMLSEEEVADLLRKNGLLNNDDQ
jgi:hypothetical protein